MLAEHWADKEASSISATPHVNHQINHQGSANRVTRWFGLMYPPYDLCFFSSHDIEHYQEFDTLEAIFDYGKESMDGWGLYGR